MHSMGNNNGIGWWKSRGDSPDMGDQALRDALIKVTKPLFLIDADRGISVAQGGTAVIGDKVNDLEEYHPLMAYAPPLGPSELGDRHFKEVVSEY